MPDRRQQLINVFQDTQKFYTENKILSAAVSYGRQNAKLYEADDYPQLPAAAPKPGGIQVTAAKTFQAAMDLHKASPDKKIAVLNFASATRPGGGVKNGSSAQEESLCRCSTLFPTIDRKWLYEKYYAANRQARDNRHTDACIYSPGVVICKTDERIPQRMQERDFVTVDVISCAAPNLRNAPANLHNPENGKPIRMEPQKLYDLHVKRARHIMHVAAANQVDILILGAFGCGVFGQDAAEVAEIFKEYLTTTHRCFEQVIFAVPRGKDKNYDKMKESFFP